ncbi:hypothetical protein [Streptomyces sp. KL116D]|uniref:hypothetical protein n=1 Tax=Streptomyces sp. KL116D TaxID=3045152 RepID=UPI00355717F5
MALAAAETLRRAATQIVPVMADEWFAESTFSDFTVHVTPDELAVLKGEVLAVVARHRERPPTDGSAPVVVQFQAFPAEGPAAPSRPRPRDRADAHPARPRRTRPPRPERAALARRLHHVRHR